MINFQTPPTQKTERIFIQENDSYSQLQKLKTQVSNKKKNEEDFEIMQDELSRLETRMKTLTAEKVRDLMFSNKKNMHFSKNKTKKN